MTAPGDSSQGASEDLRLIGRGVGRVSDGCTTFTGSTGRTTDKAGGQPHPCPEGACGQGVTPTAPCRRRRVCRAPATSELRAVLCASQTPGSRRVFQLLHDRSRGPGGWPAAPKPTAALPGAVTHTDKGRAGVPAPREGGASRNHTRGGRQQRRCGHCQVCCSLSVFGQKRRRSRQKTTVRQGIGENSKKTSAFAGCRGDAGARTASFKFETF